MPADPTTLSVLMLAHNHGPYVAEAIESVVAQRTELCLELLIGEDCSTDNTKAVVNEFASRYPERIRVISNDQNVGMHRNFSRLWEAASGEYIAFCEGDDYWLAPDKLAKQAAFLDQHPECGLCGAVTRVIGQVEDGDWNTVDLVRPNVSKKTYNFEELIQGYHFHFSSVMVRKSAVAFPSWFDSVYCVDRPLYLLAVQGGLAGFIDEEMSAYRLHAGGNWSAIRALDKAAGSTHLFKQMAEYFPARYTRLFHRTLSDILWSYMGEAINHGDLNAARQLFANSLRVSPFHVCSDRFLTVLKVAMRLYCPSMYKLLSPSHGR